MRRYVYGAALSALILTAASSAFPFLAAASAQTPYDSWVGKYPFVATEDPALKPQFQDLLKDEFPSFSGRLQVATPIARSGDFLFGKGCIPHNCGDLEAAFTIDVRNGAVVAVEFSRTSTNRFALYGAANPGELPAPLQEWIRTREK